MCEWCIMYSVFFKQKASYDMRISDWSSDECASDLGVERAFDALLLRKILLAEHLGHQVALLDADTVFAGEHPADLDAQPQNVAAERLGAIEFAGLVGVIEDQRMQVAVAGMEHVRYPEAVFLDRKSTRLNSSH